ncbi:MAG: 2-oxoglutarate and iron-dependent oxygenase domain-containing protein [Actinomycetota bacterium]|mgnify:CR=1 FL=1|nr:2-oxoglutarate and iron-dependent oxygenase domain-containing protein [Actinomycetota bacterium]
MTEILDVDLLAFENGSSKDRLAAIDGVMRSLITGFVYTKHDLSEGMLDETYEVLSKFFALPVEAKNEYVSPGSRGQTGYTGLLVETAAISDTPDWKEMLNWGTPLPDGHPLRDRYPHRYGDPVFPSRHIAEAAEVLTHFHECLVDLQTRFLRIIAAGVGANEHFFDTMLQHGSHLTRAISYPPMAEAPNNGQAGHVWAEEHGDINLITALPRATTRGLQVKVEDRWVDATPPDGHVIINTGIMLERLTNGLIPVGWHRVVADPSQTEGRLSVVQFCHPTPWTILSPIPSTISPERPCNFPAISAGDCLDQVIWEINLGAE